MRDPITQLHIPRTGGTALREAMRGYRFWRMAPHPRRLEDVDGHCVVTLRDPVDRFVSACLWGRLELAALGYRDPDDVALDIKRALGRITSWHAIMFTHQVWWVRSAEYVQDRCLWVGRTEHLDEELPGLLAIVQPTSPCVLPAPGDKARNAAPGSFTLGHLAEQNVRTWYAVDDGLLEDLA